MFSKTEILLSTTSGTVDPIQYTKLFRVRGIGQSSIVKSKDIETSQKEPNAKEQRKVYFKGGEKTTNLYLLGDLLADLSLSSYRY